MQSRTPWSVSHALRGARGGNVSADDAPAAAADTPDTVGQRSSLTDNVINFPGRRPTDGQLRHVLGVLANTGPMSVRHLKMDAGFAKDILIRCVERLAEDGLLTAEDRKDGNDLRLIVSATDTGQRLLAAGVEDGAAAGASSGQEELG